MTLSNHVRNADNVTVIINLNLHYMYRIIFFSLLALANSIVAHCKELSDAEIGDYIYSNGEVYSIKDNPTSKCIGVVVSLYPTIEQIELGYNHGTFVLLQDIPGRHSFYNEEYLIVPDLPRYGSGVKLDELLEDRNGYQYTYQTLLSNSDAAKLCEEFVVPGDFHSPCFIPTPGQWYEMLVNIGLADIDDNRHINNAETVASRLNSIIGGFNKDDRNTPSHERNKYWLAAQSFNGECGWCGRTDYVGYNNFHVNLNEKYRYGVSSPGLMDGKTKKRRIRPMCYF